MRSKSLQPVSSPANAFAPPESYELSAHGPEYTELSPQSSNLRLKLAIEMYSMQRNDDALHLRLSFAVDNLQKCTPSCSTMQHNAHKISSIAVGKPCPVTFISFCVCGSSYVRPIKRFVAKTVLVGFVTACRLAGNPTSLSPFSVKATTEGVVRAPSEFSITLAVCSQQGATRHHKDVGKLSVCKGFEGLWVVLH